MSDEMAKQNVLVDSLEANLQWERYDQATLFVFVSTGNLNITVGDIQKKAIRTPGLLTTVPVYHWFWKFHFPKRDAVTGEEQSEHLAKEALLVEVRKYDQLPTAEKERLFKETHPDAG